MTVEELLAKLDKEYKSIEGELSALFERLGRVVYKPLLNTVTGLYASDVQCEHVEIKRRLERMETILDSQRVIRKELK